VLEGVRFGPHQPAPEAQHHRGSAIACKARNVAQLEQGAQSARYTACKLRRCGQTRPTNRRWSIQRPRGKSRSVRGGV
jgi:hypothetical protein